MKMVMEKSWNMKKLSKVMEFCVQSWSFTNFAPQLYQICSKQQSRKSVFSNVFLQNVANAKSGREMVMENQEMVMEKSWKNILSSLWELTWLRYI